MRTRRTRTPSTPWGCRTGLPWQNSLAYEARESMDERRPLSIRRRRGRARHATHAAREVVAVEEQAAAGLHGLHSSEGWGRCLLSRLPAAVARRGGRYPAGAHAVAVGLAGRLPCDARRAVARRNSLRELSLAPFKQSPRVRSRSARCARADRPAALLGAPEIGPTWYRPPRSNACGVRRGIPRWCWQNRGRVCVGSDLCGAEERKARGRARAARAQ